MLYGASGTRISVLPICTRTDSTTLSEFTLITIPHYVVIVAWFDAESSSDREGG